MMHLSSSPFIELGVNIDHIATVRNARGTVYPDPLEFALMAQDAGAEAITLHLREDRRHIRDADVRAIKDAIWVRMNLESAITEEMINFALSVMPSDVCLVPERREELTTEGGLDVRTHFKSVESAVKKLTDAGIRVSLFIDADQTQIDAAHAAGAPVVELHTGAYADVTDQDQQIKLLAQLSQGAQYASSLGLCVNAGHGLTIANAAAVAALPDIRELNIGHAIVARALNIGWMAAIREIKAIMVRAKLERT